MNLTTKQTATARYGLPSRWEVLDASGGLVGFIERYRKSARRTNDYKAYYRAGNGFDLFNNFKDLDAAVKAIGVKLEGVGR